MVCFADFHILFKISHFHVSEHCRIDFTPLINLEEVTIYVADLEHQFDWLGKIVGWRSPCLKKVTFEVEEGPLYTPLTGSTWDNLDGIVSNNWRLYMSQGWSVEEGEPQLFIFRKNTSEEIPFDPPFTLCRGLGITVNSKNL